MMFISALSLSLYGKYVTNTVMKIILHLSMTWQSLHHNVGSDRLRLHLSNATSSASVLQPLKIHKIDYLGSFLNQQVKKLPGIWRDARV